MINNFFFRCTAVIKGWNGASCERWSTDNTGIKTKLIFSFMFVVCFFCSKSVFDLGYCDSNALCTDSVQFCSGAGVAIPGKKKYRCFFILISFVQHSLKKIRC